MNTFLTRWVDLFAVCVSIIAAIFFTLKYYHKGKQSLKAIPLFFMVFGPMAIFVHMVMHLFAIGWVAGQKISAGTFVYDFRFYSLVLMAGVLGGLSMLLLRQSTGYFLGFSQNRTRWFTTCFLIVLVSAPTIPFTFIGSLPVQAVVINLFFSLFVRKPNRKPLHSYPKGQVIEMASENVVA